MLKKYFASLSIEILKVRKSTIFIITLGAACFISLMLCLMMVLVMHPDALPPGILKTKVDLAAFAPDWPNYIYMINVAAGAIGIILYGFIASWIFGREFNDRTLKDILSLPATRTVLVVSKLTAAALWCILLSLIILLLTVITGMIINLPGWTTAIIPDFLRIYFICILLNLLLLPPVTFVASAGRGYLPAIGFVVLCMGLANFFGNIGLGAYFSWSIPMLFTGAIGSGKLSLASLVIMAITTLSGIAGTVLYWKYADHSK